MTEQTNKPDDQNKPGTVGDSLQNLVDAFKRTDITLPQAIIIAAVIIALGIIFS